MANGYIDLNIVRSAINLLLSNLENEEQSSLIEMHADAYWEVPYDDVFDIEKGLSEKPSIVMGSLSEDIQWLNDMLISGVAPSAMLMHAWPVLMYLSSHNIIKAKHDR